MTATGNELVTLNQLKLYGGGHLEVETVGDSIYSGCSYNKVVDISDSRNDNGNAIAFNDGKDSRISFTFYEDSYGTDTAMSIHDSASGQTAQYKSDAVIFGENGTIRIGNCSFQAKEDSDGIVLFDARLSSVVDGDNEVLRMSANEADFIEYLNLNV